MRHRRKAPQLGKPADQRKAMLRSLATSLFTYDEISTTLVRAKALKREADRIVTLAKRGDVHAIRQVAKIIYPSYTGEWFETEEGKQLPETVLHRVFHTVAPKFAARQGGYTRVLQMPPRRGDAAPMALVQLTYLGDVHAHGHHGHDHAAHEHSHEGHVHAHEHHAHEAHTHEPHGVEASETTVSDAVPVSEAQNAPQE